MARPKTILLQLFAEQGCLLRMVGGKDDATKKELQAIQEIEGGKLYNRPSSFIVKDIAVPPYGTETQFGIFVAPTAARAFYKQQTYSNSIPNIIENYFEERPNTSQLEYMINKLNRLDGSGHGKIQLKNLERQAIFDKLLEMRDRSTGKIPDIDTKSHVLNFLTQLANNPKFANIEFTKAFEKAVSEQDLPEYLKRQIRNTFSKYLSVCEDKSIKGLQAFIQERQVLKLSNWNALAADICYNSNNTSGQNSFDGFFGGDSSNAEEKPFNIENFLDTCLQEQPETDFFINPSLSNDAVEMPISFDGVFSINTTLKEGSISLQMLFEEHPLPEASRILFIKTFQELYPGIKTTDMVGYDKIKVVFDTLHDRQIMQGIRYAQSTSQYTDPTKENYKHIEINECIAFPCFEDILGIHFHPDMSEANWQQAELFYRAMLDKEIELSFFCYDPKNPEQLAGPFNLTEARQYKINRCEDTSSQESSVKILRRLGASKTFKPSITNEYDEPPTVVENSTVDQDEPTDQENELDTGSNKNFRG